MQAVEFEATIENGIVHIPKKYKDLQNNVKATFVVMYDKVQDSKVKGDIEKELDRLFEQSNNKITATMELATNISRSTSLDKSYEIKYNL